jgi:hypothetical protein
MDTENIEVEINKEWNAWVYSEAAKMARRWHQESQCACTHQSLHQLENLVRQLIHDSADKSFEMWKGLRSKMKVGDQ